MNRAIAVACLALLVAGCDQDPYLQITLGEVDAAIVKPDACPPCTITNNGRELCDYKDNDCDCSTDEDFNLNTDSRHCGKCDNSCALKETITACVVGKCRYKACNANYHDLNKDLAQGWDSKSDGCEYYCVFTGTEKCDGKDNDCDGKKDEDFNLQNDVKNCSKCGSACNLANAVPKCVAGKCKIQSCKPGFIDKDGKQDNGCEAKCAKTNGGVEKCDGVDNDCNKVIDDVNKAGVPIDHKTDKEHCGGCNISCLLPNADALCLAAKCSFSGCKSGWVNADKNPANGCECKPTTIPLEKCDGKDNDCDGKIDTDSGGKPLTSSCYTGPSGTLGKGLCKGGTHPCNSGTWGACQGEVKPRQEHCDGKNTACVSKPDPAACVFAATGRESRLDEPNVSAHGAFNSTQLTIAGSGNRILAAWVDRRKKKSDIFANVSTDGGKTWLINSDISVATEANNKLEPQVAFGGPYGSSLRAYVVYEKFVVIDPNATTPGQREVYLRRSNNGGLTWGKPVAVKAGSSTRDALYVRLAVQAGSTTGQHDKVVICWEEIFVTGAVRPNIYCRLSTNSGSSFTSAVRVNNSANNAILPRLAMDANYLYVTWQQGKNILVDRTSLNNALWFGLDTVLDGGAGQEPQIVADGTGRVVVVWEDLRDSLVNIRANASSDSGSSWLKNDVRVDLDPAKVNGDSTKPSITARPGGRVFVTWEDTIRGKWDIYSNSSSDGGKTWGKTAARVPTTSAGASSSRNPFVAVEPFGKTVYVAWDDVRNGSYRDIYFSVSLDDGKTWNVPDYRINEATAGKADARKPILWVAPSRVAVLWLDNRLKVSGAFTTGAKADIYSSYLE